MKETVPATCHRSEPIIFQILIAPIQAMNQTIGKGQSVHGTPGAHHKGGCRVPDFLRHHLHGNIDIDSDAENDEKNPIPFTG